MSTRKRMMKACGWEYDKLDEMAIKKIEWEFDKDNNPTKTESDTSAREFAKKVVLETLQGTAYWDEAQRDAYEKMTDREIKLVNKHIDTFTYRIYKMLKPKK